MGRDKSHRKYFFVLAGLLAILVSSWVLMYLDGNAFEAAHKKEAARDQKSKEPPPVHGGVTTPGGPPIPMGKDNKPLYFFESKAEWTKLGIKEPRTGWEFAQRGMYNQDELGDIDTALADYQKAAVMEPELMIPRARMGSIYLRQGRYDEAIREFQTVTELDPEKQEVHYRIGLAYEGKGDYGSAIQAYLNELELAPGSVKTNHAIAMAYQKIGDDRNATFYLGRYLEQTKLHGDNYPLKIELAKKTYAALKRKIASEEE